MRLVEQHIIKRNSMYYNELQDLLHKCKNLYNKGLYLLDNITFNIRMIIPLNINTSTTTPLKRS